LVDGAGQYGGRIEHGIKERGEMIDESTQVLAGTSGVHGRLLLASYTYIRVQKFAAFWIWGKRSNMVPVASREPSNHVEGAG
jgi:hypothetical protein